MSHSKPDTVVTIRSAKRQILIPLAMPLISEEETYKASRLYAVSEGEEALGFIDAWIKSEPEEGEGVSFVQRLDTDLSCFVDIDLKASVSNEATFLIEAKVLEEDLDSEWAELNLQLKALRQKRSARLKSLIELPEEEDLLGEEIDLKSCLEELEPRVEERLETINAWIDILMDRLIRALPHRPVSSPYVSTWESKSVPSASLQISAVQTVRGFLSRVSSGLASFHVIGAVSAHGEQVFSKTAEANAQTLTEARFGSTAMMRMRDESSEEGEMIQEFHQKALEDFQKQEDEVQDGHDILESLVKAGILGQILWTLYRYFKPKKVSQEEATAKASEPESKAEGPKPGVPASNSRVFHVAIMHPDPLQKDYDPTNLIHREILLSNLKAGEFLLANSDLDVFAEGLAVTLSADHPSFPMVHARTLELFPKGFPAPHQLDEMSLDQRKFLFRNQVFGALHLLGKLSRVHPAVTAELNRRILEKLAAGVVDPEFVQLVLEEREKAAFAEIQKVLEGRVGRAALIMGSAHGLRPYCEDLGYAFERVECVSEELRITPEEALFGKQKPGRSGGSTIDRALEAVSAAAAKLSPVPLKSDLPPVEETEPKGRGSRPLAPESTPLIRRRMEEESLETPEAPLDRLLTFMKNQPDGTATLGELKAKKLHRGMDKIFKEVDTTGPERDRRWRLNNRFQRKLDERFYQVGDFYIDRKAHRIVTPGNRILTPEEHAQAIEVLRALGKTQRIAFQNIWIEADGRYGMTCYLSRYDVDTGKYLGENTPESIAEGLERRCAILEGKDYFESAIYHRQLAAYANAEIPAELQDFRKIREELSKPYRLNFGFNREAALKFVTREFGFSSLAEFIRQFKSQFGGTSCVQHRMIAWINQSGLGWSARINILTEFEKLLILKKIPGQVTSNNVLRYELAPELIEEVERLAKIQRLFAEVEPKSLQFFNETWIDAKGHSVKLSYSLGICPGNQAAIHLFWIQVDGAELGAQTDSQGALFQSMERFRAKTRELKANGFLVKVDPVNPGLDSVLNARYRSHGKIPMQSGVGQEKNYLVIEPHFEASPQEIAADGAPNSSFASVGETDSGPQSGTREGKTMALKKGKDAFEMSLEELRSEEPSQLSLEELIEIHQKVNLIEAFKHRRNWSWPELMELLHSADEITQAEQKGWIAKVSKPEEVPTVFGPASALTAYVYSLGERLVSFDIDALRQRYLYQTYPLPMEIQIVAEQRFRWQAKDFGLEVTEFKIQADGTYEAKFKSILPKDPTISPGVQRALDYFVHSGMLLQIFSVNNGGAGLSREDLLEWFDDGPIAEYLGGLKGLIQEVSPDLYRPTPEFSDLIAAKQMMTEPFDFNKRLLSLAERYKDQIPQMAVENFCGPRVQTAFLPGVLEAIPEANGFFRLKDSFRNSCDAQQFLLEQEVLEKAMRLTNQGEQSLDAEDLEGHFKRKFERKLLMPHLERESERSVRLRPSAIERFREGKSLWRAFQESFQEEFGAYASKASLDAGRAEAEKTATEKTSTRRSKFKKLLGLAAVLNVLEGEVSAAPPLQAAQPILMEERRGPGRAPAPQPMETAVPPRPSSPKVREGRYPSANSNRVPLELPPQALPSVPKANPSSLPVPAFEVSPPPPKSFQTMVDQVPKGEGVDIFKYQKLLEVQTELYRSCVAELTEFQRQSHFEIPKTEQAAVMERVQEVQKFIKDYRTDPKQVHEYTVKQVYPKAVPSELAWLAPFVGEALGNLVGQTVKILGGSEGLQHGAQAAAAVIGTAGAALLSGGPVRAVTGTVGYLHAASALERALDPVPQPVQGGDLYQREINAAVGIANLPGDYFGIPVAAFIAPGEAIQAAEVRRLGEEVYGPPPSLQAHLESRAAAPLPCPSLVGAIQRAGEHLSAIGTSVLHVDGVDEVVFEGSKDQQAQGMAKERAAPQDQETQRRAESTFDQILTPVVGPSSAPSISAKIPAADHILSALRKSVSTSVSAPVQASPLPEGFAAPKPVAPSPYHEKVFGLLNQAGQKTDRKELDKILREIETLKRAEGRRRGPKASLSEDDLSITQRTQEQLARRQALKAWDEKEKKKASIAEQRHKFVGSINRAESGKSAAPVNPKTMYVPEASAATAPLSQRPLPPQVLQIFHQQRQFENRFITPHAQWQTRNIHNIEADRQQALQQLSTLDRMKQMNQKPWWVVQNELEREASSAFGWAKALGRSPWDAYQDFCYANQRHYSPLRGQSFSYYQFANLLGSTGLVGSYNAIHNRPFSRMPSVYESLSEIGGVATQVGTIEGLKDLLYKGDLSSLNFLLESPDGEMPFTKQELRQIQHELYAGTYQEDAFPWFSLHIQHKGRDETREIERGALMTQYPVLHPIYQNTLVGAVIGGLDASMKGFINGADYPVEFRQTWCETQKGDPEYFKANMIDLRQHYREQGLPEYRSLSELSFDMGLEKSSDQESRLKSEPGSIYSQNFMVSFRIIAKQLGFEFDLKTRTFLIKSDFDVLHDVELYPHYQAWLEAYRQKHGKYPEDYARLKTVYKKMAQKIHDEMPLSPLYKKMFQQLKIISFFSYLFKTLKDLGIEPKLPPLDSKISAEVPREFPCMPRRYVKHFPVKMELAEVLEKMSPREIRDFNLHFAKQVDHPAASCSEPLKESLKCLLEGILRIQIPAEAWNDDAISTKKFLDRRTHQFEEVFSERVKSFRRSSLEGLKYFNADIELGLPESLFSEGSQTPFSEIFARIEAAIEERYRQEISESEGSLLDQAFKLLEALIDRALKEDNLTIDQNTQAEIDINLAAIHEDYALLRDELQDIEKERRRILAEGISPESLVSVEAQVSAFYKEKLQLLRGCILEERKLLEASSPCVSGNLSASEQALIEREVEVLLSRHRGDALAAAESLNQERKSQFERLLKAKGESQKKSVNTARMTELHTLKDEKKARILKSAAQTRAHNLGILAKGKEQRQDLIAWMLKVESTSTSKTYVKVNFTSSVLDMARQEELSDKSYLIAFGGCGLQFANQKLQARELSREMQRMLESRTSPLVRMKVRGLTYAGFGMDLKWNLGALSPPDYAETSMLMPSPEAQGASPLMVAATTGQTAELKELLEAGANPNQKMPNGATALFLAIQGGWSETALMLIQTAGPVLNLNSVDPEKGLSPLHVALSRDLDELALALIEAGADIGLKRKSDGKTPFHYAASRGMKAICAAMLARPEGRARASEVLESGYTALHLAAEGGYLSTVLLLFEHLGVEALEIPTHGGQTPLLLAVAAGHRDVMVALAKRVDPKTKAAAEAVSQMAKMGAFTNAEILISRGVDITYVDAQGNAYVDYLRLYGESTRYFALAEHLNLPVDVMHKGRSALAIAMQQGRTVLALELMRRGAPYQTRDPESDEAEFAKWQIANDSIAWLREEIHRGKAPFKRYAYIAAEYGSKVCLELLLQHIKPHDLSDAFEGKHVFYAGLQSGKKSVLKMLLSHSPKSVNEALILGDERRTLGSLAQSKGYAYFLDFLRKKGAMIPESLPTTEDFVPSPLMVAAAKGAVAEVERLIAEGADVNREDPEGNSALQYAIQLKQVQVALRLIPEMRSCSRKNRQGRSSVMEAATQDLVPILLALNVRDEKDRQDRHGRNALHLAAGANSGKALSYLIEQGFEVNGLSGKGYPALVYAAVSGSLNAFTLLLHCSADPWAKGVIEHAMGSPEPQIAEALCRLPQMQSEKAQIEIWFQAARAGNVPVLRELTLSNFPVQMTHVDDGPNALHLAALGDAAPAIRLLCLLGLALDSSTLAAKETALHWAAREGAYKAVRQLCDVAKESEKIAVLDQQNTSGQTAAHLALEAGHPEIVCILIKAGAHADIPDKHRSTVAMLARVKGIKEAEEVCVASQ